MAIQQPSTWSTTIHNITNETTTDATITTNTITNTFFTEHPPRLLYQSVSRTAMQSGHRPNSGHRITTVGKQRRATPAQAQKQNAEERNRNSRAPQRGAAQNRRRNRGNAQATKTEAAMPGKATSRVDRRHQPPQCNGSLLLPLPDTIRGGSSVACVGYW